MTTNLSSNSPYRVLIVDDEPLARQRVRDLLHMHSDVTIIAEAAGHDEAVAAIREQDLDLVFLDVQMPGKSGIDVIRTLGPEQMPATVFVTAHDEFAIDAFDLAAVDYLLKPFDDNRFQQSLKRVRQYVENRRIGGLAHDLMRLLSHAGQRSEIEEELAASTYLERIAVQARGQVQIVPVRKIRYITAEGVYVQLHTAESTHLIREQLSSLEKRIDPATFFRIHRSTIVRLEEIDVIYRGGGGNYAVRLHDGKKLSVSRSRVEALEQRLQVGY